MISVFNIFKRQYVQIQGTKTLIEFNPDFFKTLPSQETTAPAKPIPQNLQESSERYTRSLTTLSSQDYQVDFYDKEKTNDSTLPAHLMARKRLHSLDEALKLYEALKVKMAA